MCHKHLLSATITADSLIGTTVASKPKTKVTTNVSVPSCGRLANSTTSGRPKSLGTKWSQRRLLTTCAACFRLFSLLHALQNTDAIFNQDRGVAVKLRDTIYPNWAQETTIDYIYVYRFKTNHQKIHTEFTWSLMVIIPTSIHRFMIPPSIARAQATG